MFWRNFVRLCESVNKSPNKVTSELGLSNGTATGWKKGAIPQQRILVRIANYFDVTVDDLLGDKKEQPIPENGVELSEKDMRLLNWFRSLPPEKQKAILIAQDAPEDLT